MQPGIEREYKHVLAKILRSLFVARTPSEETRSPGRRSNVGNAPRHPPVSGQQRAQTPPSRPFALCRHTQLNSTQRASMDAGDKTPQCPHLSSHYFISILSRDGRKLVTRVRVMLP